MKRIALVVIAVSALAGLALAAATPAINYGAQWIKGGLGIGPTYTTGIAGTLITGAPACKCDEDFASIANGYWGIAPNTCACSGVKIGDPCLVGVLGTTPADAGSGWYPGMELQAVARGTNLVELDAFNRLGDGGAIDPPDAGYLIRCFSPQ